MWQLRHWLQFWHWTAALSSMPVQEGEHELLEEPVEERQEVSQQKMLILVESI